jgi:hypothetical protein
MAGALAVSLLAFRYVLRRGRPLLDTEFHLPDKRRVDAPLVVGALVFGVGWGLAGFCPGPAIVGLASGAPSALLFVAALAVGAKVGGLFERRKRPAANPL